MDSIALIYRKKLNGRHSIERLFSPMDNLSNINRVELPYDLTSLASAIKLFLFGLKIKEKTIHITGDVHYMAIFLFWKKIIITMHDCNHYEDLTGIKKKVIGLLWFRIPILISKKIIVISPFVKEQLQKHFKLDENKIIVIPNTFNKIEQDDTIGKQNIFEILVIGTKKNKNVERLLEAIKEIKNIQLQIVGKLQKKQINLLKEYKILYSNHVDISQKQLCQLYNSSHMLYFASTKEGFGLPILEAQSCGLPVLTSNTTSMPYVAGFGALLVNPYCVKSITSSIIQIISNKDLRDELVLKGYSNVNRFGESNFVASYTKIYNSFK